MCNVLQCNRTGGVRELKCDVKRVAAHAITYNDDVKVSCREYQPHH